jgi:hypothetical protein
MASLLLNNYLPLLHTNLTDENITAFLVKAREGLDAIENGGEAFEKFSLGETDTDR